jgi:hypothetical protein
MNGVRRKKKSPNLAWARGTKYGNQNVDDEVIFSIACVREVTGLEKKISRRQPRRSKVIVLYVLVKKKYLHL